MIGTIVILSGCVTASDPSLFTSQNFAPGTQDTAGNDLINTSAVDQSEALRMASQAEAKANGEPPSSPNAANQSQTTLSPGQGIVMAGTGIDALHRGITQTGKAQPMNNLYSAQKTPVQVALANPANTDESLNATQATSATSETPKALAIIEQPKKKSIFSRLFATQAKATQTKSNKRTVQSRDKSVQMASIGSSNALPGVRRPQNEFGEGEEGNVELASAAGLARLAPNGLHLQTDKVKVACLKPKLVRVLKTIERHYGRPVIVTSGYRSPRHNRLIGGVSHSRHTTCEAADIQIKGVSKWQLAKYIRSMPGRGGVGTYCHTESVHVDIGTERDWNWRCRRRKN